MNDSSSESPAIDSEGRHHEAALDALIAWVERIEGGGPLEPPPAPPASTPKLARRAEAVRRVVAARGELDGGRSQLADLTKQLEALVRGELPAADSAAPASDALPELRELRAHVTALSSLLGRVLTALTRVATEVGEEGRLGAQSGLSRLPGAWGTLASSVDRLAASFTAHVRALSEVTLAVARGDVSKKLELDVRGEPLHLVQTVNEMIEQLQAFSLEVTRVAREVGTERVPVAPPRLTRVAGVWKDLTDNVGVTEQLALASRHKSRFLASMSHELRTPLNSLLVLAKVLSENRAQTLGPREVEYAKTIYASGNDLLQLMNEILDLSKVEAGRMRINPEPVSLAELADFVERDFAAVAAQKGLGFAVERAHDAPGTVHTDPLRLRQILRNLLSNAFKFTERGRVVLRIEPAAPSRFEAEPLRNAPEVVAFTVEDTGIGIPAEKQELIFEPFRQADRTTTSRYGGTGLGLTICRELARLLGGELRLESTPGSGSAFTLHLPRRYEGAIEEDASGTDAPLPSAPPVLKSVQEQSPGDALAGKRVLVVDPDIRRVFALTALLERQQAEVVFAQAADAGLELLRAKQPDAVLLAFGAPELDAAAWLRSALGEPRAPRVVALAADEAARDAAFAAGALDVVERPIDPIRLVMLLAGR